MWFWKVLGSLLVMLPLDWGMVTAFHLLNLPSDRAVLLGLCLLLFIAVGGFIAFKDAAIGSYAKGTATVPFVASITPQSRPARFQTAKIAV